LECRSLTEVLDSQVGVRELTNSNDGVQVNAYQKSTGNKTGDSWCASFCKWCWLQIGRNIPITGWSPSCFNPKNIVYFQGKFKQEPKTGDLFTIYSIAKKRIVHTGCYYSYYNSRVYVTVEGNTSNSGAISGSSLDTNGNGVYKKLRSYNATYAISRF